MYEAIHKNAFDYFKMLFGIDNEQVNQYYMQMNNWHRVYETIIYNDNHTIIRVNALMRLISFGYYNVHNVLFNFLSFAGLVGIFSFVKSSYKGNIKALFVVVFFIPSVTFWGSGVLKESLILFAIGVLLFCVNKLILVSPKNIKLWLIAISMLIIMMFLKIYIIISIFPLLIAYFWISFTKNKYIFIKYLFVFTLFLSLGLSLHYLFPKYNAIQILVDKQHDFINLAKSLHSGSIIQIEPLNPDIISIVVNIPQALINSLFRPHLFETKTIFMSFSAIENFIIFIFILFALFHIKIQKVKSNIFLFCFFFAIINFIIIGLTTPVIGALVRYKVPALLFFLISLLLILDIDKIKKNISRFIKQYPKVKCL